MFFILLSDVWFRFVLLFCFDFTCILALWALGFVFRVAFTIYLFSVALRALKRAFSSFEK